MWKVGYGEKDKPFQTVAIWPRNFCSHVLPNPQWGTNKVNPHEFSPSLWVWPCDWCHPLEFGHQHSKLSPSQDPCLLSLHYSLVFTSAWGFFIETAEEGILYFHCFSWLLMTRVQSSFTKVCTTLYSGTLEFYSKWAPKQPDLLHRAHPSLHFPILKGSTYLGSLLLFLSFNSCLSVSHKSRGHF